MSEPFKVRASSWAKLFDCAYKFEGENLLGMRKPSGPPALLGTAIHAGTAAFDLARLQGSPITADDACGALVDALQHPKDDVDWSADDDITPVSAERVGLTLVTRYCTEWSPKFTFEAVELETKPMDIDCGGGVVVRLTGTLDRSRVIAGANGGKAIYDLKSGGTAVQKGLAKTKGHRAQLGTYELLEAHTTGEPCTLPAGIIGLKTKGTPEIATGEIRNARELMVGTAEAPGLLQHAALMFRTGMFPPNPSSHLCAEKFCARWHACPYHE